MLEYDSDRAGGFEPLRLVPKDTLILHGLGLDLKLRHGNRRRTQSTHRPSEQVLPVEQFALSPQCSFSGIDLKVLNEDEMWKKFDTIVKNSESNPELIKLCDGGYAFDSLSVAATSSFKPTRPCDGATSRATELCWGSKTSEISYPAHLAQPLFMHIDPD